MLIKELVLLRVEYFLPDYNSLLNEFFWQTRDIVPTLPRITRFLDHWRDNIDAEINTIEAAYSFRGTWKKVDFNEKFQDIHQ